MNATVNAAHVRLELSSRAENVPIVRQALAGLADTTGLPPADLNDIGTALTEACNNASMHAYGGVEGPLEVELFAMESTMAVTVRDRGLGLACEEGSPIEFPTNVEGELAGIGLPSIMALASDVRWIEPEGGGTAVEMTFSTGEPAPGGPAAGGSLEPLGPSPPRPPAVVDPARLADTIEVEMAPLAVARGVLPRLLRAVAARANFSIERHADVQRVGSALLADDASGWAARGGVLARLTLGDARSLEVAIGPMAAHDATQAAAAIRLIEPALQTSTVDLGGAERLVLRMKRSRA